MNVLSLCDGMSCGQIALKELGIKVDKYYAAEIDKNAIKVTQDNFPDTIQIGDVTKINEDFLKTLPKIDLVMFGSPCRSLSKAVAGRERYDKGLNGVSWLFYPCNNILQWIKKNNNLNVKFLVENVDSYHIDDLNIITKALDINPIMIDSALFSAQRRKRNYWTNIKLDEIPVEESNLFLYNILEDNPNEKYYYKQTFTLHDEYMSIRATLDIKGHDIIRRVYNKYSKCPTLTCCRGGNLQKKVFDEERQLCRKLTPLEYRRLQTIPNWYKMNVSDSAIYNLCGDGWTIEVIKFILKNLK